MKRMCVRAGLSAVLHMASGSGALLIKIRKSWDADVFNCKATCRGICFAGVSVVGLYDSGPSRGQKKINIPAVAEDGLRYKIKFHFQSEMPAW